MGRARIMHVVSSQGHRSRAHAAPANRARGEAADPQEIQVQLSGLQTSLITGPPEPKRRPTWLAPNMCRRNLTTDPWSLSQQVVERRHGNSKKAGGQPKRGQLKNSARLRHALSGLNSVSMSIGRPCEPPTGCAESRSQRARVQGPQGLVKFSLIS